jgi:hypothetical protein
VRALCGRAVRAYNPALDGYQQTLEYIEVESVVKLSGLCRNCVTSFKVSVHYDGETRRRLEGEMHDPAQSRDQPDAAQTRRPDR